MGRNEYLNRFKIVSKKMKKLIIRFMQKYGEPGTIGSILYGLTHGYRARQMLILVYSNGTRQLIDIKFFICEIRKNLDYANYLRYLNEKAN